MRAVLRAMAIHSAAVRPVAVARPSRGATYAVLSAFGGGLAAAARSRGATWMTRAETRS